MSQNSRETTLAVLTIVCFALLINVLIALSGCSGWKQSTYRGLQTVREIGKTGREVAAVLKLESACDKPYTECLKAKLSFAKCTKLQSCHKYQSAVPAALATIQSAAKIGAKAIDASDEFKAGEALALAFDAGRDLCKALDYWGQRPKVCDLLGGTR
jgi:hypothetical protein